MPNLVDLLLTCGLEKYADRVDNFRCPLCGRKVMMSQILTLEEMTEYEESGICGPCQDEEEI